MEPKNSQGTSYIVVDWRDEQPKNTIKPKDVLICCDLRDCELIDMNLSKVQFFGCRFNGTSFRRAILQETEFIGCFASPYGLPADFQNCVLGNELIIESSLYYIAEKSISGMCAWDSKIVGAATDTLSERNDIRYSAAIELGTLENPVVAPILACLLTDQEWDVRSIALETLGEMNLTFWDQYPGKLNLKTQRSYYQVLLELMFERLCDEHSIVRQEARELVENISPSDEVLLNAVQGLSSASCFKQLAGLNAAIELCRIDESYSRLINPEDLQTLCSSEVLEVRDRCTYLLELLDH